MSTENNDPRKQVARLLRRRPGWSFQAMSAPGSPLVWCYGSGREVVISVTVDNDAISVHVTDTDQDVELDNADELVEWLKTHIAGSLQNPKDGVFEKLKSGKLFKWE
jgi:hypothetical protein